MFRIYHKKGEEVGNWPNDYSFVAIASAASSLSEAKFLTSNKPGFAWYQSVLVQPANDNERYRSTESGDIIVDTKQNIVYLVDKNNFIELTKWNSNEKTNVH